MRHLIIFISGVFYLGCGEHSQFDSIVSQRTEYTEGKIENVRSVFISESEVDGIGTITVECGQDEPCSSFITSISGCNISEYKRSYTAKELSLGISNLGISNWCTIFTETNTVYHFK